MKVVSILDKRRKIKQSSKDDKTACFQAYNDVESSLDARQGCGISCCNRSRVIPATELRRHRVLTADIDM